MSRDEDLHKVKCCASCEYGNTDFIDGVTMQCSAYVIRKPKIYEVCETFYPDIDVWEEE